MKIIRPAKIKRIIKTFEKNDKTLCIDRLEKESGIRFSHRDLKFTKDVYFCDCCNGYRHSVTGMKIVGYFRVLFNLGKKRQFDYEKVSAEHEISEDVCRPEPKRK